ncbi:MAG TPA: FAD binding domain-containing protein [Pseudolabrys sp.]|nr:FAD binding domain-containing protein [Pseudolabrys sp.]
MKPAAFNFVRAANVGEATRLLEEASGDARLIAGAQSLGPMLNLRLAQPRILVDITGIPELKRIEDGNETVMIGACVTTANIEDGRLPGLGLETLASVARNIAYRAVRNRGTIGGSLCHADPAADWVSMLCVLEAECLIAGPGGMRRLRADQFITGAFTNALGPAEMLEAISVPRLSARGRCGYFKVCRKAGEFALAIGAVLVDPDRGKFRAVIGAAKGRPIIIANLNELRGHGGVLDEHAVMSLLDEHGVTDPVDRRQKLAALKRAYEEAAA